MWQKISTGKLTNPWPVLLDHYTPSLKQAVYRAVYVEVNAQLQIEASRLGPIEYLSEGEAHATQVTNEGQVERPWNLWKTRAIKAQKSWLAEV